jgi:Na+-driven multidrug efflux pump
MAHHARMMLIMQPHSTVCICLTNNSARSTRVSNELGAGRPQAARLAVRVVVFLAVSEGLAVGLILVCVRYVWGHAYSDVEEVVTYVAKMMLVIAVSNFFDGIQCVLSGSTEFISYTPNFLFWVICSAVLNRFVLSSVLRREHGQTRVFLNPS